MSLNYFTFKNCNIFKAIRQFTYVFIGCTMITGSMTLLQAEISGENVTTETQSTWQTLRNKTRMQVWFETMSPAFQGNPLSVPKANGTVYSPAFIQNISWIDYEMINGWKLLYSQKLNMNLAGKQSLSVTAKNPRFGIRKSQVWKSSYLLTDYDLYLQPAWGAKVLPPSTQQSFESGFKTSTTYIFPHSQWTIGFLTDIVFSFYSQNENSVGPNVYGGVQSWTSYRINSKWSTQHWIHLPFFQKSGTGISWDGGTGVQPYVQNGICFEMSPTVSMSAFINMHLLAAPRLQNTWASLWLNLAVL